MKHLFIVFATITLSLNTLFAQESKTNNFSVSISRVENEHPISLKEWLEYTKMDASLRTINQSNKKEGSENNNELIHFNDGKQEIPFEFNNGIISANSPSKETIFKMYLISKRLHAEVKDSNGKIYSDKDFYKN